MIVLRAIRTIASWCCIILFFGRLVVLIDWIFGGTSDERSWPLLFEALGGKQGAAADGSAGDYAMQTAAGFGASFVVFVIFQSTVGHYDSNESIFG